MTKIERTPYRQDIAIEDLLTWTYQVQRAHLVLSRGAGMHPLDRAADGYDVQGIDSLVRLERIAELGVRVDGGGTPGADMHPDAEMVVDRIALLSHLQRGLVEWYGKTGMEPDWVPGGMKLEPRLVNDKPLVIYEDAARRKPLYCPVVDNQDSITFARKMYLHWWDAMASLAQRLVTELTSFNVHPPRSARTPWSP
jgi:hypothetical protein